jgi:DNA-binding LytR/AlgR family response regulator
VSRSLSPEAHFALEADGERASRRGLNHNQLFRPVTPSALIADDEEAPRAQLLAVLGTLWPELSVVSEAANGIDAWDGFLEREPQLCFLDVRMPGLTGVEVAQRIGAHAHVVFVAAPGDHALAAFDAGSVDYVLKPVDAERLSPVVERMKSRLANAAKPPADLKGLLDQLAGQIRRPAHAEVIPAGPGHDPQLIPVDHVIYFETEARHTRVVHARGETPMRQPLKELLGQLDPARFWQIHRSVIVNREHIARVVRDDDGNMVVVLRDRTETLPVARHFQALFDVQ